MLGLARNAGDGENASRTKGTEEPPVEILEERRIDGGEGARAGEKNKDAQNSHGRE